jgi:tetratricopeptide (TPR) repeat protein
LLKDIYYYLKKRAVSCKLFVLVISLFASLAAPAQLIKNRSIFRMLQTANSLVEAKQFEAAEQYFKTGLAKAKQAEDIYLEAFAHEGLGNLYNKMEQPNLAIDQYKTAIKLYKKEDLTVLANIVESLLKSVQGIGDLYAGIEVGAKGVKLSVIEVILSRDREYGYTLKMDTSINTDAASLSYQSEKETSNTLAVLLNIIKTRYPGIAASKQYIVISSGLKQELDKYEKLNYFTNIIRPKTMDPSIKITFVTPEQEAELSMMGIVPDKHRFTAGQLDVGSGNTKGGFFNDKKVFVPFTFPVGTKSFQRMIEPAGNGDINSFVKKTEQYWIDSLQKPLTRGLADTREIKLKDIVYLSGGIVWSIVSLRHPESVNNNYVEITSSDIDEFRQMIVTNYEKATQVNLSVISNADDSKAAAKNIGRVLKTFDQKAMIAGAVWLNHLVQEMNSINPSKKFIYSKYAYVGWISGYIVKKVTQQYVRLEK